MRGSRRRLSTFWLFALVSMPIAPSRKPYHMATRWMLPSWFIVAMDMEWRPCKNSSTSSWLILMTSRCLTPTVLLRSGGQGRVDGDDRAADVSGFVASEERDHCRAVLRQPHGAVRHDPGQQRHRRALGKLERLGDRG